MADELDDLKRKVDLALENIGLKRENEQLLNDLTDVSISFIQGAARRPKQTNNSDTLRKTLKKYQGSNFHVIVKLLQSAFPRCSEKSYQDLVAALGEEDAQSFVSCHGIAELERVVNICLETRFPHSHLLPLVPNYQLVIKALNPYSDGIRQVILEQIESTSKPESKNHTDLESMLNLKSMLKTLSNAHESMRKFIEKGTFGWSPETLIKVAYELNPALELLYSINRKYQGEAKKLVMGSLRKEFYSSFIERANILDEDYIAHIARFYDTEIIKTLLDLIRNSCSKEVVLYTAKNRARHSSPVRGETAKVYLEMLADTLSIVWDQEIAEWELAKAKELDPSIVGGMPFYHAKYCDFNHGEFEHAFLNLTEEITSNPHSEAYLMRGIAIMEILKKGLPDKSYVDRGIEFGSVDDAIDDFDKAIELDPKNAEAHFYRGEAYFENAKKLGYKT